MANGNFQIGVYAPDEKGEITLHFQDWLHGQDVWLVVKPDGAVLRETPIYTQATGSESVQETTTLYSELVKMWEYVRDEW